MQIPRLAGRVLVADDVANVRLWLAALLRAAGLVVVEAADGREVLTACADGAFDLVLLDMQMPELDGISAARELRRRGWQAPIIAISADADTADVQRYREAGCNAVLAKPVDDTALFATLGLLLPAAEPTPRQQRVATKESLAGIHARFADSLPALASNLLRTWQAGARDELATALHRLKGSAALFGHAEISAAAAAAERSLDAAPAETEAALQALIAALRAVRSA